MKDSRLEWIEQIPETWTTNKMKYLFDFGKGLSITKENLIENGLPVISYGQIHSKNNSGVEIDKDLLRFVSFDYKKNNPSAEVKQYDFVFADTSEDYEGCGNCVYKRDSDVLYGGYHVVIAHSKKKDDKRYFAYLFKTDCWRMQLREKVSGVKVFSITQKAISNTSVIVPPQDEQIRIADFLDAKCKEIDFLITDIYKEIEILESYKKSVITEVVVGGLNKSVRKKESGIEWAPTIPEHWSVKKGKYIFSLRNQKGNKICLQLLSPTQKFGVIPQSMYEELTGMGAVKLKEDTNYETLKTIHKGDFCISLRSFQGGFEYSEYEGVVSPAYQVFYPMLKIADGYFKYMFKERGFIEKMNSYTLSLRDGKNIAFSDFGNSYLPIPPYEEQVNIANFLDKTKFEIDQIINEKHKQISTLEEYKKSVIYEYVTGKKSVN